MVARVLEVPQEKEKSVSCLVEISWVNQATKNYKTQGKAQVYLAKTVQAHPCITAIIL